MGHTHPSVCGHKSLNLFRIIEKELRDPITNKVYALPNDNSCAKYEKSPFNILGRAVTWAGRKTGGQTYDETDGAGYGHTLPSKLSLR